MTDGKIAGGEGNMEGLRRRWTKGELLQREAEKPAVGREPITQPSPKISPTKLRLHMSKTFGQMFRHYIGSLGNIVYVSFFLQSISLISCYTNINRHNSIQMLHISTHFINCSRWSEEVPPPNHLIMLEDIIFHYLTISALCALNKWVFILYHQQKKFNVEPIQNLKP